MSEYEISFSSTPIRPGSGFNFVPPFTGTVSPSFQHGATLTINAPPGTFPDRQYGTSPWIYDRIAQQWVNGVAQNAYAGFTDGQAITHAVWTNLSQDSGDGDTQTYSTSRSMRTSYDTAQYSTVGMNNNGKGFVGEPVWPAIWGTQNNQMVYVSFWGRSQNPFQGTGGGDQTCKALRLDLPSGGTARGGIDCSSSQGGSWTSNRTSTDGDFHTLRTGQAGVWLRYEYWVEVQYGGSAYSSGGNLFHTWIGAMGSGQQFKYCSNSAYGVGGSFEICHAADIIYSPTLSPTNSWFDPNQYSQNFSAIAPSLIGYDDGHGLSTGNAFDIAEIYLDADFGRFELTDQPTWDRSPASAANSEIQAPWSFNAQTGATQAVVIANFGQYSSGSGKYFWLANPRDRASAMLVGFGT